MKIKLNRQIKAILIAIILCLICFVSLCIYYQSNNNGRVGQNQPVNNYSSKSNVNYAVNLKPNNLYSDNQQSEDNIYISPYVDNIKAIFNYTFKSEKTSNIKGSYTVLASVEGCSGDKSSSKTIWKKEFKLLPEESIDVSNKEFSISKEVLLNFNEYNSFAQKIIEESKINTPVKLTVSMLVNLTSNVEGNITEKNAVPSIVIPLNTPYFEITKTGTGEKPGTIQAVNREYKGKDKASIFVLAAAEFVLFFILVYILFFTVPTAKDNLLEKRANRIFREHGNRFVALIRDDNENYKSKYSIKSIEDLVKVADELSKPIFYKHCSENKNITKFYVVENEQTYEYDLLDELESHNKNTSTMKQMRAFNEEG